MVKPKPSLGTIPRHPHNGVDKRKRKQVFGPLDLCRDCITYGHRDIGTDENDEYVAYSGGINTYYLHGGNRTMRCPCIFCGPSRGRDIDILTCSIYEKQVEEWKRSDPWFMSTQSEEHTPIFETWRDDDVVVLQGEQEARGPEGQTMVVEETIVNETQQEEAVGHEESTVVGEKLISSSTTRKRGESIKRTIRETLIKGRVLGGKIWTATREFVDPEELRKHTGDDLITLMVEREREETDMDKHLVARLYMSFRGYVDYTPLTLRQAREETLKNLKKTYPMYPDVEVPYAVERAVTFYFTPHPDKVFRAGGLNDVRLVDYQRASVQGPKAVHERKKTMLGGWFRYTLSKFGVSYSKEVKKELDFMRTWAERTRRPVEVPMEPFADRVGFSEGRSFKDIASEVHLVSEGLHKESDLNASLGMH